MTSVSRSLLVDEFAASPCDGDGVAQVWLAQSGTRQPPQSEYLTLSRFLEDDDGPYIERDDQRWGCYREFDAVELGGGVLTIRLSQKGAEALGGIGSFRADLSLLTEAQVKVLEIALASIFAGENCYRQVGAH